MAYEPAVNKDNNDRISSLEREVGSLAESTRSLHDSVDRITRKFDEISAAISERNRTDWKALFTAGSLILAVVVIFSNNQLQPFKVRIDALEQGVVSLRENAREEAQIEKAQDLEAASILSSLVERTRQLEESRRISD